MLNSRVLILTGIAALVAVVLVWKWIAGWGYVTLDVRDAPLAKVIKSIESQGGVKIRTNADPATPVTMLVDRVPAYEAIDTLAVAVDGNIRLAYVAAENDRQIKDVLAAFSGGTNPGGWTVYAGGFGGRGGGGQGPGRNEQGGQPREQQAGQNAQPREQRGNQPGDQARERRGGGPQGGGDGEGWGGGGPMPGGTQVDPRLIVWKPTDTADKNLQTLFDQGSQKTGALFALPEGWNPSLSKLPKEGRTGDVTVTLVKNAKGTVQEVFLLTIQPPRPQTAAAPGEEGGRWEFSRTVFTPQRGGGQRNAEWMAERAQAQIAALPKDQQAEARKQMDEMRAFWESVRNLPEEERRAKIEEVMNRPEVQDRMEESRNAHDSKTPPQRREDRMRRYIERKAQVKGTPAKS